MTRPLSIGVAGLGTVGAGVLTMLRENADLIAARAGRAIAVTAVSARDRGRDRGVALSGLRWYDDAVALAARSERRRRRRADRRRRRPSARPRRGRARRRQAGRHRQQGADRRAWRRPGRARPRRPASRWPSRRPSPAASRSIKTLREGLAGNRHQPRRRHPQRHLQLHPHRRCASAGANSPRCWPRRRSWATPRPTRPSTSTASTPRTSWRSWPPSPSAARSISAPFMSRASATSRALDIAFAERARLPHQAARHRPADRGRASSSACIRAWSASARPIARVDGVFNAVVAEGDFVGRVMLEGRGAGAGPTASAVVADLIDIARGRATPVFGRRPATRSAAPIRADGGPCRRLLPAPDGGRPPRRHRRCRRRRCATTRHLDGMHAAARPQPGRGGAGGADHPRDRARPRCAARSSASQRSTRSLEPPTLIRIEPLEPRNTAAKRAQRPEQERHGGRAAPATRRSSTATWRSKLVRVTEAAALAASPLMGRGDEKAADQAAVDAMRKALDTVCHRRHRGDRRGRARRGADALHRREGRHRRAARRSTSPLDPLEGTTITAKGGPNAHGRARHGRARRLPQRARHLHGQDRGRRRPARRAWSISTAPPAENLREPRRGQGRASSPISSSASSTGRATRNSSPRCARPARASC